MSRKVLQVSRQNLCLCVSNYYADDVSLAFSVFIDTYMTV